MEGDTVLDSCQVRIIAHLLNRPADGRTAYIQSASYF